MLQFTCRYHHYVNCHERAVNKFSHGDLQNADGYIISEAICAKAQKDCGEMEDLFIKTENF